MANVVDIENRSYELKLEGPVIKIGGGSDIPDINAIRNNAQLGANAYNTISTYGDIVTHDADEFATAAQGALASTALQAGDDVSKLVNDAGYITSSDLSHYATKADLTAGLSDKQDRLVSGTNIKTINGIPLVGSGNITVGGSVTSVNSKTGAVVLTASDVDALPDTTKYGYAIDLEFDEAEDHLTVTLKDQDGATLSSKYIDLALESVVVGGAYDSTGQKIVLTLKNGDTVDVPVGDLVDGLQAEITSTHKLNADLVDDSTSVNKFTTAAEKATWNGKQDAISDLATIRAGATAGSTALQVGDNVSDLTNDAGYITSTDLSNYTTQTYVDTELDKKQDKLVSGTTLKTINNNSLLGSGNIDTEYTAGTGISITSRAISVDNTIAKKSEIPTNNNQLTNGAGYITGITSSDVVTALGYTPYDSSNPDGFITGVTSGDIITALGFTPADTANLGTMAAENASDYTKTSALATVAMSGSYNDLTNKPTIPTVNNPTITFTQGGVNRGTITLNQSTDATIAFSAGSATVGWDDVTGKPTFATVATSGDYNDLSNKPTIPTVNNATLTIQKNGTSVGTFTANASANSTVNITVPTNTNELTNGAGFITGITSGDVTTALGFTPANSANLGTMAAENASDYTKTSGLATVATSGKFTDLTDKPTTLSGYGITDGADTDLSNLTATGKNISNWSTNVSNCITEIPQDIKLELNNGVLTLKAGSKVYIPNGADTFNPMTISADVSDNYSSITNSHMVFYNLSTGLLTAGSASSCFSGPTAPTSPTTGTYWYNTTNNTIQCYNSGWQYSISLPICVITSGGASFENIFNGFGYMGNTVFALPGIKGLIPDGRNADGTLRSTKFTTTAVNTATNNNTANGYSIVLNATNCFETERRYYDKESNYIRYDSTRAIEPYCICGVMSRANGRITRFSTSKVFRALDYSDSPTVSGWSMPSNKYVALTLGASGTQYTAPEDGWFYVGISATGVQGVTYVSAYNVTKGYGEKSDMYRHTTEVVLLQRCLIPVSKGDVVAVAYYMGNTMSETTCKFMYTNATS